MAVALALTMMSENDRIQLAMLVARFGFRISDRNARSVGVHERVLFDAVVAGLAKIERICVHGDRHILTTYLVFA